MCPLLFHFYALGKRAYDLLFRLIIERRKEENDSLRISAVVTASAPKLEERVKASQC